MNHQEKQAFLIGLRMGQAVPADASDDDLEKFCELVEFLWPVLTDKNRRGILAEALQYFAGSENE